MASQNFCLKWNDHTSYMINVFSTLRDNNQLIDVTLCCPDDSGAATDPVPSSSVSAHRLVLCACSPYLCRMLASSHPMSPTSSSSGRPFTETLIVMPPGTHVADLRAVVEFMYSGEVQVAQSCLSSFLRTAELLQVRGLCGDDPTSSSGTSSRTELEDVTRATLSTAQRSGDGVTLSDESTLTEETLTSTTSVVDRTTTSTSERPTKRRRPHTQPAPCVRPPSDSCAPPLTPVARLHTPQEPAESGRVLTQSSLPAASSPVLHIKQERSDGTPDSCAVADLCTVSAESPCRRSPVTCAAAITELPYSTAPHPATQGSVPCADSKSYTDVCLDDASSQDMMDSLENVGSALDTSSSACRGASRLGVSVTPALVSANSVGQTLSANAYMLGLSSDTPYARQDNSGFNALNSVETQQVDLNSLFSSSSSLSTQSTSVNSADDTQAVALRFVCELCGRGFKNSIRLSEHRSVHRGDTTCSVCLHVSSSRSNMRSHMRTQHNISCDTASHAANHPLSVTVSAGVCDVPASLHNSSLSFAQSRWLLGSLACHSHQ